MAQLFARCRQLTAVITTSHEYAFFPSGGRRKNCFVGEGHYSLLHPQENKPVIFCDGIGWWRLCPLFLAKHTHKTKQRSHFRVTSQAWAVSYHLPFTATDYYGSSYSILMQSRPSLQSDLIHMRDGFATTRYAAAWGGPPDCGEKPITNGTLFLSNFKLFREAGLRFSSVSITCLVSHLRILKKNLPIPSKKPCVYQ